MILGKRMLMKRRLPNTSGIKFVLSDGFRLKDGLILSGSVEKLCNVSRQRIFMSSSKPFKFYTNSGYHRNTN